MLITCTFGLIFSMIFLSLIQCNFTQSSSSNVSEHSLQLLDDSKLTISKSRFRHKLGTFGQQDDLRLLCGGNHGFIVLSFRRCFSVETIPGTDKNQQLQTCYSKNAILTYPRSTSEMEFLWNTFDDSKNWVSKKPKKPEDGWFFHLGFARGRRHWDKRYLMIDSLDGKFYIDNNLAYPIDYVDDYKFVYSMFDYFRKPPISICMTKSGKNPVFIDCLPRETTDVFICSFDF